ncbi:MAG: hypothetical protein ACREPA_03055 [Candidatus Dormibacteraceae bacterium]
MRSPTFGVAPVLSSMGSIQTFFYLILIGVALIVAAAILIGIAIAQLVSWYRTKEDRLTLYLIGGAVLAVLAFIVIGTFGVTYGAFQFHG